MLTDREAFRLGFLLRCAEEQLSPVQIRERIKAAAIENYLPGAGAAKTVAGLGLMGGVAGLGLSAAAGAGGGWLAAKATEPDMDAEDAKMQELIAAYRQQAEQARRTAARIGYRMQTMRPRGRISTPIAA